MATTGDGEQQAKKKRRVFEFQSERKRAQASRQSAKNKTRVFLLDQIERWRTEKATTTAKTDADFARILLDSFQQCQKKPEDRGLATSTPVAVASTSVASHPFVAPVSAIKKVQTETESDSDRSRTMTAMSGIGPLISSNGTTPSQSPQQEAAQAGSDTISHESDPVGIKVQDKADVTFVPDPSDESSDEPSDIEEEDSDFEQWETTNLDITDAESMVYDILLDDGSEEDEEDTSRSKYQAQKLSRVDKPSDVIGQENCIAFKTALLELASLKMVSNCTVKGCKEQYDIQCQHVGTCIILLWKCRKGHIGHKWSAQPRFTAKGVHAGDFTLAANILLSGNNYRKIMLLLKFMKMGVVSQPFFDSIQTLYAVPVINKFFDEMLQETWTKSRETRLVLAGDGRNDSPGHSAQYCVYTLMDEQCNNIMSVQVVDKREVGRKSTNMEKEALKRGIHELTAAGLTLSELVTDAHVQIAAMLRKDYPAIQHQWDIWHGAKNMSKKLTAVAMEKEHKAIMPWVKDIIRHFWFCAEKAEGSKQVFMARWRGFLHHVTNKHEWMLGYGGGPAQCDHAPLDEAARDKEWIEAGSKSHERLRQIILDKRFLNNVVHYVNFRHTGTLENFHTHLLMYTPKRITFTYPIFKARTQLAAIDFQLHKDREVVTKADGTTRQHRVWSKATSRWTVVPVKAEKQYSYIPQLQTMIAQAKLDDTHKISRKREWSADDPRSLSKTLAPTTPPPTDTLVQQKVSRFKHN